ncbi:type I pullulanase [uncultured Faecalibaculum sp.]|uniref:type I pullulanase n=2 Tax=uncultured Faecalibaculum sp. TaxID=1729681 RepID=UPI00272C663E|nr:type I pullulanase [uncultured Faecalibaculum sp.]
MRMREPFEAYFDDYDKVNVYKSNNFFGGKSRFYHLKDSRDRIIEMELVTRSELPNGYVHSVLRPLQPIEVGEEYYVYDEHCQKTPAVYSHITKTSRFARDYEYDGPLGAVYTPEAVTFRLWAPTAHRIIVTLKQGTRTVSQELQRKESGIFEVTVPGDWNEARYTFMVRNGGKWLETVDPYSFFGGMNGKCSIVVDPASLNLPEKIWMPPLESNTDAIIYEASVRDMTSANNIGVQHPSTFRGFTEESAVTHAKRTGFSYLKSLGVTHVQLLPVFDFGSVDEAHPGLYYNWGYDPMHFRTLEGSYSLNPDKGAERVQEFANLVHDLHAAGLRVNLDLVFNHVYSKDEFSLERLVPYYYFLMNQNGEFSNGSFCGNDIDTQPVMSRRYFVETCRKIVQLYDVDGFRFDLMGILDVNLMNEIAEECRKIKPGFMIYGEGWNMPSFVPPEIRASQENQGKMPNVGHFSDRFRDIVRGSNGDLAQTGFASGNTAALGDVMNVMAASCGEYRYDSPQKAINYVECHDNHTLWDKNKAACHGEGSELRDKRQVFANAVVLLSQGVPFLHAGQEFGRSKEGIGNTYNRGDNINQMDYHRRDRHSSILRDTKKLIEIRKNHRSLRLRTSGEIADHVRFETINGQCLVYRTDKDGDRLICFLNPTGSWFQYGIHELGHVLFDNGDSNQEYTSNLVIAPYSVLVCQLES